MTIIEKAHVSTPFAKNNAIIITGRINVENDGEFGEFNVPLKPSGINPLVAPVLVQKEMDVIDVELVEPGPPVPVRIKKTEE